jgi:tetratricopeptide (TPR) repeat protein
MADAPEEPPIQRSLSAPGRIDGQAAARYRQAQSASPVSTAAVTLSTATVSPPPPPPAAPPYGLIAAGVFVVLGGAVGAALWKKRRDEALRRAAEAERLKAAAPPPPKPDDEAALLAGAADEAKRDTVADYVLRAGRLPDFLSRCRGRDDRFLAGYAWSFVKLGAWETAISLFNARKTREPREQTLCAAMSVVVSSRGGRPAGEVYAETLLLAAELARRGAPDEAVGFLAPAVIQKAAAAAADCRAVAGVFLATSRTAEFLAQAKVRKHPSFYRAYAEAFHALKDPDTALKLILMKQPRDASDYELFVACHKELGRVAGLSLAGIPDAERLALAGALVKAGEDAAALKALREERLEALSRAEQALALGVCARLKDMPSAGRLFQQIKLTVGLADAPELYLAYAAVCEAVGQLRDARDVYEEVLRRFPGRPEAVEGLRRLGV